MKKLLVLLITITVLGLTACGDKESKTTTEQETTTTTEQTTTTEPAPVNPNSVNDIHGNKTPEEWSQYYSNLIDIDNDGNGTPDWQETEMTITYASNFYDDEDIYNTLFRNALKFAEKYPNITVVRDQRFKKSAGGDDWIQLELLLAAAQDNTMPDVFYSPLSAEVYDQDLTLDLLPYLRSDAESQYLTQNAVDFIKTYDGEAFYGVPYMSVASLPAVNVGLLEQLNIEVPSYDWTYEEYEDLRTLVGGITEGGNQCVFPGIIDWSVHGSNYFDSIPNGWMGFNLETQRFDFASATNYGTWFEQVADEGKWGWHFYDLTEEERTAKCGNFGWPWGDGFETIGNIWFYDLSFQIDTLVKDRQLDIEIYPMPQAPEGGTTALRAYYDTFSLAYTLEDNPVKAQAVYELAKWLSYGEEGTAARWQLIDDDIEAYAIDKATFIADGGTEDNWPRVHPSTHLMDYIMGWPATVNPNVLENHPMVKGFDEDGPFAAYNFDVFKDPVFQAQLSGPVAYPRQIPAAARAYGHLDIWEIKNQIKDENYAYSDIASQYDDLMNTYLDDYLRNYVK